MKLDKTGVCDICGQRKGLGQGNHTNCSKIRQAQHAKDRRPRSLGVDPSYLDSRRLTEFLNAIGA